MQRKKSAKARAIVETERPRGRPQIAEKRRRLSRSINLHPLTWALLDRVVDVTPRATRSTIVERVVWQRALADGLISAEESDAAMKSGVRVLPFPGKTA
jgi:hypothetical protein